MDNLETIGVNNVRFEIHNIQGFVFSFSVRTPHTLINHSELINLN